MACSRRDRVHARGALHALRLLRGQHVRGRRGSGGCRSSRLAGAAAPRGLRCGGAPMLSRIMGTGDRVGQQGRWGQSVVCGCDDIARADHVQQLTPCATMSPSVRVSVIGVPLDLGAGRRGVDMGPSAFRLARHRTTRLRELGYDVQDAGDVDVPIQETQRPRRSAPQVPEARSATTCERCATAWRSCWREGRMPVVLGGDHSIAMGTIAGVSKLPPRAGARRSASSGSTPTAT